MDVLIHPGYTALRDWLWFPQTARSLLYSRWDRRITCLRSQKTTLFFLFSILEPELLTQDLSIRNHSKLNPVKRFELNRIARYQKALGNRFFLYSDFDFPNHLYSTLDSPNRQLRQEVHNAGFTYDPNKVLVRLYGEVFEACVSILGRQFLKALSIPAKPDQQIVSLSASSDFNGGVLS